MTFSIDSRIASTCFHLMDWPLSSIFLKNNAQYPWLILVPRHENVQAMDQMPKPLQHQLMDEISALSAIVRAHFKPDSLNIGALGNIVPQLHVHVVARFTHDALWPHGVWQAALESMPYTENKGNELIMHLRHTLTSLLSCMTN